MLTSTTIDAAGGAASSEPIVRSKAGTIFYPRSMRVDERVDFRRAGERVAIWLAISFLMERRARSDPAFLADICRRFDQEFAELRVAKNQKDMDRIRATGREYFQQMVLTAEAMAKESDAQERV